jgi:hypothetical protein
MPGEQQVPVGLLRPQVGVMGANEMPRYSTAPASGAPVTRKRRGLAAASEGIAAAASNAATSARFGVGIAN